MENIVFPASIQKIIGSMPVLSENVGRSGAFVAYIGDELVLKRTEKGQLQNAQKMQTFLSGYGLAPEVVHFETGDFDYMISKKALGRSAIDREYRREPRRLARALGEFLLKIHSLPVGQCPVSGLTDKWIGDFYAAVDKTDGVYKHISEYIGIETLSKAKEIVNENAAFLASDTVLHGDYCLPNVMLTDFEAKHAIDLGEGGVGDRHFDLFWGLWSLSYNLKTDAYGDDFLSAYGKKSVNKDLIVTCGCLCAPDGF